MSNKDYVSVQELSSLLNVPKGTIYYWVSRNEIPYIRFGRHLRFLRSKVINHFENKTEEEISRRTCKY